MDNLKFTNIGIIIFIIIGGFGMIINSIQVLSLAFLGIMTSYTHLLARGFLKFSKESEDK